MRADRPDLDLTQVHFERPMGDITLFGTWFGAERKPALVLLPTSKIGREGPIPCVIPLASAWRWAESTGDPKHCARVSVMFAHHMGFDPFNPHVVIRITSLIRDHIGDLLSIPPKPTERVVVADAVRTDEHGREHHSEISENV